MGFARGDASRRRRPSRARGDHLPRRRRRHGQRHRRAQRVVHADRRGCDQGIGSSRIGRVFSVRGRAREVKLGERVGFGSFRRRRRRGFNCGKNHTLLRAAARRPPQPRLARSRRQPSGDVRGAGRQRRRCVARKRRADGGGRCARSMESSVRRGEVHRRGLSRQRLRDVVGRARRRRDRRRREEFHRPRRRRGDRSGQVRPVGRLRGRGERLGRRRRGKRHRFPRATQGRKRRRRRRQGHRSRRRHRPRPAC